MTRDDARLLAHASVDGELDPAGVLAFEAELAAWPALRAEHERISELQASIRRGATRFGASATLRRSILGGLPGVAPRAEGRASLWRALAIGASAACVVLIALLVTLVVERPAAMPHEQLVTAHVRALMGGRLTDVASSDRHAVKPWLGTRLAFSPPVRDLAIEGFRLEGARLDSLAGRPVAAIVYKRREHVINVFVWPQAGAAEWRTASLRGFNVVEFGANDMRYALVSDVNAAELRALAEHLRRD